MSVSDEERARLEWSEWQEKVRWSLILSSGRGEREVSQELMRRGEKPCRQWPIGKYFADIALVEQKIAIEMDDRVKFNKRNRRKREERREALFREEGWTIIRIDSRYAEAEPGVIWELLDEAKAPVYAESGNQGESG